MVDGASGDGTAEAARAAGARVLHRRPHRGVQLACGAAATRGDALLFLHADARLPPAARGAIERALADPAVSGGCFRLRFDPPTAWARFFTRGHDVHRRLTGRVYGDSAIFVRRASYAATGGFRPLPLLEDDDLVRRLRRRGRFVVVADVDVRVSGRRFARRPVRTALGWASLECLALLGVPPRALARLYPDVR